MNIMKTLSFAFLIITTMPLLSAKYYARVVKGYKHLIGRVVIIEGTVENALEIKDIWRSHRAAKNMVIQWYKEQNPPRNGTVYYGADGDACYCFHETWIKVLAPSEAERELSQQEESVLWISPDGTFFGNKDLAGCDAEKEEVDDDDKEALSKIDRDAF
jgi:hypothetical protein